MHAATVTHGSYVGSSHGAIPVGAVFVLCVWTMRLDFPLWCEWSNLGLPPPPPPPTNACGTLVKLSPVISPVVVKDCNPVGTVNRLSGDSDIYVVES